MGVGHYGRRERTGPAGGSGEQDTARGSRRTTTIDVAYRPADPTRVRTVVGWSPAWVYAAVNGSVAVGLPVLVFGLVSRARTGRIEAGTPLPATTHDPGLGHRVVRSVRWMPVALGGLGLVLGTLLGGLGVVVGAGLLIGVGVGAGFFALLGSFGGALQWYYGRDGVWETDTELVVRCRGRQRRWPWTQVAELGVALHQNMVHPVARLHDGVTDATIDPGWMILAKPLLGPAAKYTATRRIEALATGHELPFTEGLSSGEVSDGLS